jgi:hypothetical protein
LILAWLSKASRTLKNSKSISDFNRCHISRDGWEHLFLDLLLDFLLEGFS